MYNKLRIALKSLLKNAPYLKGEIEAIKNYPNIANNQPLFININMAKWWDIRKEERDFAEAVFTICDRPETKKFFSIKRHLISHNTIVISVKNDLQLSIEKGERKTIKALNKELNSVRFLVQEKLGENRYSSNTISWKELKKRYQVYLTSSHDTGGMAGYIQFPNKLIYIRDIRDLTKNNTALPKKDIPTLEKEGCFFAFVFEGAPVYVYPYTISLHTSDGAV